MGQVHEVEQGDGWAVGSIDAMGEGPGFRKVRKELGVTAFGVNAIVVPPGITSGAHNHDEQEELYLALRGEIDLILGDEVRTLAPGGFARVDAATPRAIRNSGDADAVYVCVGGKDGYVGRDGHLVDGESRVSPISEEKP